MCAFLFEKKNVTLQTNSVQYISSCIVGNLIVFNINNR